MKKKLIIDRDCCALSRWVRIMKLSCCLLFIAIMQVSASVYSQNTRFSLHMKNSTLNEVFQEIERQSEFTFLYNNAKIDVNKKVSLNIKGKRVEEILDRVLDNSGISYKVIEKQVILASKQQLYQKVQGTQQKGMVKGKVTDEKGEPLPGVSIVVKGTTVGTVTDIDGNYSIQIDKGENALLFSFIGMESQEVALTGKSIINIVLREETKGLDEVVVVGYGIKKKENLTGSVAVLESETLTERPTKDAVDMLQGAAPGLNITRGSGNIGETASINIRGVATLGEGSNGSPLVLIDGVEGDLSLINPQDIDNISVLKDAASSSIYGSRAPFGVILVTTKKGEKGKVVVNYNN